MALMNHEIASHNNHAKFEFESYLEGPSLDSISKSSSINSQRISGWSLNLRNEFDTFCMENNIARGSRTKCITWEVENLIKICKKFSLRLSADYGVKSIDFTP